MPRSRRFAFACVAAYCLGDGEAESWFFGVESVPGGVELEGVLPGAPDGVFPGAVGGVALVERSEGAVVEVSERFVAEVPVLGRSHAAMPSESSAGSITMRIRFTRVS